MLLQRLSCSLLKEEILTPPLSFILPLLPQCLDLSSPSSFLNPLAMSFITNWYYLHKDLCLPLISRTFLLLWQVVIIYSPLCVYASCSFSATHEKNGSIICRIKTTFMRERIVCLNVQYSQLLPNVQYSKISFIYSNYLGKGCDVAFLPQMQLECFRNLK